MRLPKHQKKISAKSLCHLHTDAGTCYRILIVREGELDVAAMAAGMIKVHINLKAVVIKTLCDVLEDADKPKIGRKEMTDSFL